MSVNNKMQGILDIYSIDSKDHSYVRKKTKLTFKIKNIISTTIPALIIRHVYNDYGNDGFVAAIGNYI